MKTVSTKVDESVYQKLAESCGKSGSISEKIRGLIEKSLESNSQIGESTESNEYMPHHDKFGNYFTYDQQTKRWKCKLNPKNVRIIN